MLAAWEQLLDRAVVDGVGGVLVVEGDPGIGKTRVVRRAREQADARDLRVLHASGGELELEHAFGVARTLLDARATVADGVDEAGVVHGLFLALAELAEDGPLVLLVDDAHWADHPSLAWLAYVTRRLEQLPIAVLVATRPSTSSALEHVARAGTLVQPAPLTQAGVGELVRWTWDTPHPEPAFVARCAQVTGGSPFLAVELLRTLRDDGVVPYQSDVARLDDVTPASVVAWIAHRFEGLDADAAALARAASLLAPGTQLPTVARVAGVDPAWALEAASTLVAASILRLDPSVEFVHPLVRSAAAQGIDAAERDRLHRRAATELAAQDAPADVVALHLVSTVPAGDAVAVDLLRRGARLAMQRGTPSLAARLLERALDEGCELSVDERLALYRSLATALARTGSPAAGDWLERAVELDTEPASRARDLAALGRARFALGRFDTACAAFERGRELLVDAGIDDDLELELDAGWASAVLFTPQIMEPESARRVQRLVERSVEPTTVAQRVALAHMAGLDMLAARDAGAARHLATTAWGDGALLRMAGPEEPALWAITATGFGLGDLDLVLDVTDAVERSADLTGAPVPLATSACVRSFALLLRGELASSVANAEQALHVGEALDEQRRWSTFLPAALGNLALAHLARGDAERARTVLDLDAAQELQWRDTLVFQPVLLARAALHLHDGDAVEALECFRAASAHSHALFGRDLNPAYLGGWRVGAVDALLALDRRGEAVELAEAERADAIRWGQPRAIGRASRALGRALGRDGVPLLEDAVRVLGDAGLRLDEAEALLLLGSTLRAAGRRTDATEVLRRALDRADEIGARPLASQAREELLVLGARPRRDRSTGLTSLTATELRVARLVADGHPNRVVAERLFVTIHTVRYHLRNVYAKVGVRERAALVALLANADDDSPVD